MTDATSAIVLTHNIDFLFLQSIVRPRLRKIGHPKLTVFADAACASGSYRQQRLLLDGLGRHYRVVQVDMGVGRRFHPKAILLAGPTKAALAVGSGNLTHGGWSANHEIWTCFESDEDGLPAISAFRDYLHTVVGLVHQSPSVSDEVFTAFDGARNPWALSLPDPEGLIGIPGDRPLLDAIVELAGGEVQQVTVCAPYYDPDGAALAELAGRFSSPIKTLLQRSHVGLADGVASGLPENVDLVSMDVEPSRFIHAKFYGFQRRESVLIVAGSANASRAALMADRSWGNAELVATQSISSGQAEELFSDLVIFEELPEFPETPPSDEWEIQANPLRIVAARFESGALEIAFKSAGDISRLIIETDDGVQRECGDFAKDSVAYLRLGKCPISVRLHCTLESGEEVSSESCWVDDEVSLGISVPERRIAAKLAEAAEAGSFSASGMFEILQLLHQHLQQPVEQTFIRRSEGDAGDSSTGATYKAEDVFSESFGRPKNDPGALPIRGFQQTDFLNVFAAYFAVGGVEEPLEGNQPSTGEPQTEDEDHEEGESEGVGNEEAKRELERRKAHRERSEEASRLRKKLLAALENVITAMSADAFVASRPPERLGADIAATALLLRKGLVDEIISEEDFADITKRLWIVLFFGPKGETSVLQKHLDSCSPEEKTSFKAAIASPRLTAALTLWCYSEWGREAPESIGFRFSAMLLAAKLPWLVDGGSIEELHGEFRRLSRAMAGHGEFELLLEAWIDWKRTGTALREFDCAVGEFSQKELAESVTCGNVRRGELLWHDGEFCVSEAGYRRDGKTRAIVNPLSKSTQKKIVGSWLVPVSELLNDSSLLAIDARAKEVLGAVLAGTGDYRPNFSRR